MNETYSSIGEKPTIIRPDKLKDIADTSSGLHESIYRSYSLLNLTKELLEQQTAPDVTLSIIRYIESSGDETSRLKKNLDSMHADQYEKVAHIQRLQDQIIEYKHTYEALKEEIVKLKQAKKKR